MKSTIMLITCGVLLAFTGLWGGAWLLTIFPVHSDYGFPALCTATSATLRKERHALQTLYRPR